MVVEEDPESDENDTIEDVMRKKAWKKVKAAGKFKPFDFGDSQRTASGYSSQEAEATLKAREESQESTLSRIRGPDSSRINKYSSLNDLSMVNGDKTRHVVIKQTTAQKAVALEKEQAERRRQIEAEEKITRRQKEAQRKDVDELFEEAPVNEAALAGIKKSKELDKARKYAAEKAKIVEESDKKTQEKLAALQKKMAAEEEEQKQAEKKKRIVEKRQWEKIREEETLKARRRSTAETLRLRRVIQEEVRLETQNRLEAEKQVARERVATLQSFKKADSKAGSTGNSTQRKEPGTVEESTLSDGGMFVPEVVPLNDETPQPAVGADKDVDKPVNVEKPEAVVDDVADNADVTLSVDVAEIQKPDTIAGKSDGPSTAPSVAQKPEAVVDKGEKSTTVSAIDKPQIAADTPSSASKPGAPSVNQTQVPATPISGASISAVASDGRRRPPEMSRRGRTTWDQDSTGSTSHARRKPQNKNADHENRIELKLEKSLKALEELKAKAKAEEAQRSKEWNTLMKQLGSFLIPQDRENITAGHRRVSSGKGYNVTSETGKDSQTFASQINFVSTIESQAKVKQKAEEARLAKYERDKVSCRRRYDREIRIVLNGQGIELDDEKIAKQVDEKMAVWEVCRISVELYPMILMLDRRNVGRRNVENPEARTCLPLSTQMPRLHLMLNKNANSPPTVTGNEGDKDPEVQKEIERAQTIRAGVEFLASQNKASNDFAKAASKFRIQDFESDESEEDPDEPETQAIPAVEAPEMVGVDVDDTLNLAALDASIIPPLPEITEPPIAKTAFLPDIVNPKEEDIMHSYNVRHRAERDDNVYDCVLLKSFHNLEEANAFAQHKLSEFELSPSNGKSETHDEDNLYIGKVIYDKTKNYSETVWVSREIVYIGDTANVKHGDLKKIIVPKVFNVVQLMQEEDGKHVGSVIATSSIKTLANKKAADHVLALLKPFRPRMDSMAYYNDVIVPSVRQSLAQAEAQDVTVDFEGVIPDTERAFTVSISENPVVGPLN